MSVRRLMAMAGGLTLVLTAAPRVQLHAQVTSLREDSRFILDAASSNIMEVRLGQLAQSKATNSAVKQFGQQMVTDHTNLENQLAATISKSGTQFKPGMTGDHEKEVDRLGKLSGAEFDRAYMTAMVDHHQRDIATFQTQAQSARSAEVRQIAANGLPVLQRHLTMAGQVGAQVGVTTGVAVTNPTSPTQNPPVTTGNPPVATQPGPVTTQTGTNSGEMSFVRLAGSSNLMEIRLGQLAQSKSVNSAVKQFGQRMVTDHTQMQEQLTATARSMGQVFTPTIQQEHGQEIARLTGMSGGEFDRAYMNLMIRGHQEDVNQFQSQSQTASSSQIRSLASSSLPLLQQHLSLAVQVGNQVGADTTTTVVTNPGRPDDGPRGDVRADAEFIRDVGADNTMQIQLAELARERARNSSVRQFAERVFEDHTRLQQQWINMASRNGFQLKSGMGSHHREKVDQLRKAKGNNFDRVYMTLMIQQHQDEVSYWQKEGRASRSAPVRTLVNRGLPTLEQHLSLAKQIGRQVGVDPEKALRNRKDIDRGRDKDKDRNRDN